MSKDSESEEHGRLVRLIRLLARETAYEVLNEHLEDCEHKQRTAQERE